MRLIQDINIALLIIAILFVIIIIEGVIIYAQCNLIKDKKRNNDDSVISKKKQKKIREELDTCRSEINRLRKKIDEINVEYKTKCSDNFKYEQKIRELTRDNEKLRKLTGKEPALNVAETTAAISASIIPKSESKEEPTNITTPRSSHTFVKDTASTEVTQSVNSHKEELKVEPSKKAPNNDAPKEEPKPETHNEEPKDESAKEKTMYASFPRSAGSSIYFSDLSDNLADDSYFELKISIISGKATFKPLDFMKIRNYDPAMVAMRTEGIKPNVASTVLGIEPGKVHIEGKDWMIDNPAIIKLA